MDRKRVAGDDRSEQWRIVTLAVMYIQDSTEEEQRLLLADLACAAWPTLTAQAQ
jgi:hypothetical protein